MITKMIESEAIIKLKMEIIRLIIDCDDETILLKAKTIFQETE